MKTVARAVLECILVLVAGLGIGLAANAANPKGLKITRDFFGRPSKPHNIRTPDVDVPESDEPDVQADDDEQAAVIKELREWGLQPIDHERVVAMYEDTAYQEERYIFVDARDDTSYQLGHIPGAYQIDHYREDQYLDDALPACRNAEKIVVYCNGGECEDSKLEAESLVYDHGIDPAKVYVYLGGIKAWNKDGLPIERVGRLSGDVGYMDE